MEALGLLIATGGYAGYSPIAPGTAGSVVGLILLVALRLLGVPYLEGSALIVVIVVGVWVSSVGERHAGREDPGFVVIDEIAGMLLTMAWVPLSWSTAIIGFLAFRLFDILKPFPVHNAEHLHGGVGIMADDLVAALYAAATVRLILWAVSGLVTW